MTEWTMSGALNRALYDALAEDPRVLVFGEDVGRSGGVFRVTDGLQAEYGEARVFDTPISEAGIAGAAVGLCFAGWRPVVEMQFDAFSYPAMEQVVMPQAKLPRECSPKHWRVSGLACLRRSYLQKYVWQSNEPTPVYERKPPGGGQT